MSRRICFALDLVDDPDLVAAYERAHAPGAVWPLVTQGIREAGYLAMEIWRTGDRLVMVAEVADDWPRPVSPMLGEVDQRWQAVMGRFQKALAHAKPGEKWVPMHRSYALDEQ